MGIEPGATGSGSKYANHCAMLPTLTFILPMARGIISRSADSDSSPI